MTKINEIIKVDELLIEEILSTKFLGENKFSMITDAVVLGLLKSVLDKAKSLNFLIESQMFAGNETLLRSVFETATYLEFILKEDTELRAEAYYLSSKIKTLKIHERSMENDITGEVIREKTGMTIEFLQNIYDQVTNKEDVKKRFRELVGDLKADKWYRVNGNKTIHSFQKVCESLGEKKLATYEIIYRMLSEETHGKEAGDYFRVKNGKLVIREIEFNKMVVSLLRAIINSSAAMVAEKYGCMRYFTSNMKPILDEL